MGLEYAPSVQRLMLTQNHNYAQVGCDSFLIYDHLITLSDEVRFVWPAQWSLGKLLYFLARYPPIIDVILTAYRYGSQSPTPSTCRILSGIASWIVFAGLLVAEFIMLIRVWAMWNRSKAIGIGLAVLVFTFTAAGAVMFLLFSSHYKFVNLTLTTSPPLPGCHHDAQSNNLFVSFLLLMVFEIVMMILTVIKGVQDLAHKQYSSSFLYKFYQDGVFYYATLSIVSLMNVVMLLAAPPEIYTVFVAPQRNFHTILSSRILLRLREDAMRREAAMHTMTAPVGTSIFEVEGTRSHRASASWFGDAHSNVAGGSGGGLGGGGGDVGPSRGIGTRYGLRRR